MNDHDPFYAQYDDYHASQQTDGGRAATGYIVATVLGALYLLYCFVDPNTTAYEHLVKILAYLVYMASRIRYGFLRWQGGSNMAGREGGALKTVFGLDSGSLRNISPTGTALRGLGTLLKSSTSDIPPGLGNSSNSCYQNSIIQGLASLRSLPDFLRRFRMPDSSGNSTNDALMETMNKLNDPKNNGNYFWLPDKLKSMSTWQQQDAQEYFSKILDQLDREAVRSLQMKEKLNCSLKDTLEALRKNEPSERPSTETLRNPLEGMLAQRVGCTRCGYSEGLSLIPFNCLTVPLGHNSLYDIRDCLDEYTKLEQIEGVECPKCTLLQCQKRLGCILEKAQDPPQSLVDSIRARLDVIEEALQDEDFSDSTIIKKCQVPKRQWLSSTKSKQAVIARPPKSLAIHVNRSLFNEYTGAQTKNNAHVQFPLGFDLGPWCLGNRSASDDSDDSTEDWAMDPSKSMLLDQEEDDELSNIPCRYELRAVVTHSGRHENGHYICYRKRLHPGGRQNAIDDDMESDSDNVSKAPEDEEAWWRLSDEDVHIASEDTVLRQGGVFMLFYDHIETESDVEPRMILSNDALEEPVLQLDGSGASQEIAITEFAIPIETTILRESEVIEPEHATSLEDLSIDAPPRTSCDGPGPPEVIFSYTPKEEVDAERPIEPSTDLNPHQDAKVEVIGELTPKNEDSADDTKVQGNGEELRQILMRTSGHRPTAREEVVFNFAVFA